VSSQKIAETCFEPGKEPVEARDVDERGQSCVLIAVGDSGPGLDPTQLQRVFETFYTTKSLGMGMGLAISRSIIEAHHGRLWVTPNAPRGAVFQFSLPCQSGL
jgi:signal transduction histidine kinase